MVRNGTGVCSILLCRSSLSEPRWLAQRVLSSAEGVLVLVVLVVLEVDTKKNETDGPYIAFRNHPIITHPLHEIVCLASCIAKGSQPAPYVNVNVKESESVFD